MVYARLIEDRLPSIAEPLHEPIRECGQIVGHYLLGLTLIVGHIARDPDAKKYQLLSYLCQDFLQSSHSLLFLNLEGLGQVARRELRFILEASVKVCHIQQENYRLPVGEKLDKFEHILSSASISVKERVELNFLPKEMRAEFRSEVGRLYGLTSKYVHLTPQQLSGRISAVQEGRTAGMESVAEIRELNALIERGLAASLVFLFHAVPSHIAGDILVTRDGSSFHWYFAGSRFIAAIDADHDYKAERQERLEEIRAARAAAIRF